LPTTQPKKTSAAGTKSGTRQSASNTKSGGAKTAAAQKAPPQNNSPAGRIAGGVICFVLFICTVLSYFNLSGFLTNVLGKYGRHFFGAGYYFLSLTFAVAIYNCFAMRVKKIAVRNLYAVLSLLLFSAIFHLFSKLVPHSFYKGVVTELWNATKGGGFVGGALSVSFESLFSKTGAAIILLILFAGVLFASVGATIPGLLRDAKRIRREAQERAAEEDPDSVLEYEDMLRERYRRRQEKLQQKETKKAVRQEYAEYLREQKAASSRSAPSYTEDEADPDSFEGSAPFSSGVYGEGAAANSTLGAPGGKFSSMQNYLRGDPDAAEPEPVRIRQQPAPEAAQTEAPEMAQGSEELDLAALIERIESNISVYTEEHEPDGDAEYFGEPEPEGTKSAVRPLGQFSTETQSGFSMDAPAISPPAPPKYLYPNLSLLDYKETPPSPEAQAEINANIKTIEAVFRSFGVTVKIAAFMRGPAVTRYEAEFGLGVKFTKIMNLSDDLALALGSSGVRIAQIPGKKSTVGIEVPNKIVSTVYLREIISSDEFLRAKSPLTFAIGKNISGDPIIGNIAKLPHLLVAGTTGSGKSVCLNSLIISILYKAKPDEVKFIMIDPKLVEFRVYNGIPHLLIPVVTDVEQAAGALSWAVVEMMKRYRRFSEAHVRDVDAFNDTAETRGEARIPKIVVLIDEIADLMMTTGKDVEESIIRIAQMGRAAGIHLVLATQSPRKDIITGTMKANIPSRIALKVSGALESRIILDAGGNAHKLVGNGDMLFAPTGISEPVRIQGTWVTDEDREAVVEFLKTADGSVSYSEAVMQEIREAAQKTDKTGARQSGEADDRPFSEDFDEMLFRAAEVFFETKTASTSILQRRLRLGYARAGRIMDQLEEMGLVGPPDGSKPRKILLTKNEWLAVWNHDEPSGFSEPPFDMPLPDDDDEDYD
jgi:S-DNA-T family DNA segregation ATPase FtsK/SpoIIIE